MYTARNDVIQKCRRYIKEICSIATSNENLKLDQDREYCDPSVPSTIPIDKFAKVGVCTFLCSSCPVRVSQLIYSPRLIITSSVLEDAF